MIQERDTVKLGVLAEIINGIALPLTERKDHGDYLIIMPQHIRDREVHLGNKRKEFCSKEAMRSECRKQCILKPGDVLVSMVGKTNWAIYARDEDFAVANQNIAIIRGRESTNEWLQLFFHTNTGIAQLESQLKNFTYSNRANIGRLADMAVPRIEMMKITNRFRNERDLGAKAAVLFRELGWEVKEGYGNSHFKYDMTLCFNNELRGIVEVKSYQSGQLRNNETVITQLETYKRELGEVSIYLFVDDEIFEYYEGRLEQLAELPRPEKKRTERKKEEHHNKGSFSIEKRSIEETSVTDRMLIELLTTQNEIITTINRVEQKVDSIAEKIEVLSKQISGFQSLVGRQLKLAATPEEEERIIHAFSEECAERIIGSFTEKNADKEYNAELNKLILTFGEPAWNKMEESSKSFLVSAKLIFNSIIGLQNVIDYSGVCILVTKALEVELGKRFCKNFIAFLKQKYPGKANHPLYPSSLLDRYGHPIKNKNFTLGSVAYVFCYKTAEELSEDQIHNDKAKLLEYAKEKLFAGKSDEEILAILGDYAESIEEVKKEYRNPSAHTNELQRVNAEECFALVVDVEKLLKRMLDSFDE